MFTIPSHRYCFYHIDSGIFWCDYPLVNIQKTMEHHHFQWVNPLFLWSFVSLNIINHHKNDHKNHVFFIRIWLKPIRCAVAIRDLLWRLWSKLFLVRLRWVCRESQRPMTAVSIFFLGQKGNPKGSIFSGDNSWDNLCGLNMISNHQWIELKAVFFSPTSRFPADFPFQFCGRG